MFSTPPIARYTRRNMLSRSSSSRATVYVLSCAPAMASGCSDSCFCLAMAHHRVRRILGADRGAKGGTQNAHQFGCRDCRQAHRLLLGCGELERQRPEKGRRWSQTRKSGGFPAWFAAPKAERLSSLYLSPQG